MGNASLDLLKGGAKKAANVAVAPKEDDSLDDNTIEKVVEADPAKMSGKEIEALIKEYGVATPEGWDKLTLNAKRKWLNDQFGTDEPAAENAQTDVQPEAKAETKALAKVKAAPKSKDVAIANPAKEGDIVGADAIIDTVHMIEKLNQAKAKALLSDLRENNDFASFRIGGVLSKYNKEQWYKPDYETFRAFVEGEHGMNYRKAMYFIEIYESLAESGVPWEKVKDLGWTKVKELASILTLENVDQWVETAS